MNIQYIGEHLFVGNLGRMFIWLSIITITMSAIFYILSLKNAEKKLLYTKIADNLFRFHFIALIGTISTLYYLITNHCFEYSYVWQYSSREMPTKFIISCFWAGQEGSYLVWAFWQGILGLMLLRTAKDWKSYVMPVFITGQFFLLSMVLGLKIGDLIIGGSPFNLLRNMPQNVGLDLFKDPNYLQMITDGNGLNPLLENVWMVIHPPSLFLGYAFGLVPFSFAIASLWRKEYHSWLKPAIIWTLGAVLTLGIGIILGGRWAYESLTFGGFWAWDPVENASLVPWLLLVATLHMMIIANKRFQSYATAYFFTLLSWFFVVYATYLTRSGVLGETSVHSFGVNELSGQMIFYCLVFLLLPMIYLILRKKAFPKKETDEVMSREFWMLIGAVVATLSAFQVIATTSIPVFNHIFNTNIAPPINNVDFYNTWQLPFAVTIGLVISISQYLHYGQNEVKPFFKKITLALIITALLTVLTAIEDHINGISHFVLLYFTLLTLVVSVEFIIRYTRKSNNLGAALTHAGFALFLTGVILAFSNSQVLTLNSASVNSGANIENSENIVLVKGKSQAMGRYIVTYSASETKGKETFYKVDFVKMKDAITGKIAFSVYPSLNRNSRMGNVFNPDTKHFINKDIYTYISSVQESEGPPDAEGFIRSQLLDMKKNDTIQFERSFVILENITSEMKNDDVNNASITAKFKVLSMSAGELNTEIKYAITKGELKRTDGLIEPLNLKLRFEGVSEKSRAIQVGIYEKQQDAIVLKAIIFPFMAVLWFGVILMFSGIGYAMIRRYYKNKEKIQENLSVTKPKE